MNNFFRDNKSLMLARLYHTIRPLKGRQWWYRVIQPIAKKFFRVTRLPSESLKAALAQPAFSAIPLSVPQTFSPATSTFGFLNISQDFPTGIDWNYHQHGLLWAFNLHYFEWLYDDNLSVEDRLQTMRDYATHATHLSIARHPYPASLRVIAWIRFVLRFDIKDEVLLGVIYNDADRIYRFPEYALDGNHLWENSIMLVCAGLFFQEEDFFKSGSNLLRTCMKEQLFEGAVTKKAVPCITACYYGAAFSASKFYEL